MGKTIRRKLSPVLKAKVAIEAMKEQKTTPDIARENGVHSSQVQKWKKHLRENVAELFVGERGRATADQEELIASLYQQIGKLQMELSWIKKNSEYLY